ncbi:MAG: hypothetical protein JJV98_07415 [Desulfosarcina sp.]|nr:hypothetical protein [Desulfobacterales bacterium]
MAQAKNNQSASLDRRKRKAAQQLYQCAGCAAVCERCGAPIASGCPCETGQIRDRRIPYRFCDDCAEEFVDYIERLQGRGLDALYWRNEAWLEVWSTWINHRAALDRHFRSKDFARLLTELKNTPSE